MASRPSVQQAVHDQDEKYAPSHTPALMNQKGAASMMADIYLWGLAWSYGLGRKSVRESPRKLTRGK